VCSEARASALESSLKNLGVEKLSKDEVQRMPWEILESKIGNWIHFMRIAVRYLLPLRSALMLCLPFGDIGPLLDTGQTSFCRGASAQ
jgi:hypothetical protein